MKPSCLYRLLPGALGFFSDRWLLRHSRFLPGPQIADHYTSDSICQTLFTPGSVSPFNLKAHRSIGVPDQDGIYPWIATPRTFFSFICFDMMSYMPAFWQFDPPEIATIGDFLMECPRMTVLRIVQIRSLVRQLTSDGDVDLVRVGPHARAYCLNRLVQVHRLIRWTIRDCADLTWAMIQRLGRRPPPRMPFGNIAFVDDDRSRRQNVEVDQLWLMPLTKNLKERKRRTISILHSSALELSGESADLEYGYRTCSMDKTMDIDLNLAMVPLGEVS